MQRRIGALRFSALCCQLVEFCNDEFDLFVRERDGTEEIVLGDFARAAFDHHHGIGGAGNDDLHPAGLVLRKCRIANEVAGFIATDAYRRDVFVERDIGDGKCRTGGAHGENVGIELGIDRKYRRDDLHVVAKTIGEKRTDRTIDLARREHAVF